MTNTDAPSTSEPGALAWQIFLQRPVFMAILDIAGIVHEVNRAIEVRGFARADFLQRHIADTPYFAADSTWRATWDARLAEVRRARTPVGYDDVIVDAEGNVRYAEATVSAIVDLDGATRWFLVEAEDTTERLQAELALREGERRAHDLLAALPAIAWSVDGAGCCDFVNQRWLDELGAIPFVAGQPAWSAIVAEDDRAAFEADWERARSAGLTLVGRYRLRDATGAQRWHEVRVAPVPGEAGDTARWLGVAVDLDPHAGRAPANDEGPCTEGAEA